MKLMYAVRGADLPTRLSDPGLHDRLADVGVRRLQLNLDDEAVAPALRIATGPDHIGAVVSTWTDGDDDGPITAELGGAVESLEGWEVDEHRPIPPPETTYGVRTDALANLALLRRPDDLTPEEWRHRWLVDHTPVAVATQATFGYVQNLVTRSLSDAAPRVDALVEELFPMAAMSDVHAFYGSDGDDAELRDRITRLMASCARFGADRDLDLVPSSRYVFELEAR